MSRTSSRDLNGLALRRHGALLKAYVSGEVRIAHQDFLKAILLSSLHTRFLGLKMNLGGGRSAQDHLFDLGRIHQQFMNANTPPISGIQTFSTARLNAMLRSD